MLKAMGAMTAFAALTAGCARPAAPAERTVRITNDGYVEIREPGVICRRTLAEHTALLTIEAIRHEAAGRPEAAWEGVYAGNLGTFGVSRRLGAALVMYGCAGYGEAVTGPAAQVGDLVAVAWRREDGSRLESYERLVPVRWGERRYLIPEEDMLRFCNDVNTYLAGVIQSAFSSMYPMRVEDRNLPVHGRPSVPPRFEEMILAAPVTTRVVSVEDGPWRGEAPIPERSFIVTVDRGSRDGLRAGMLLHSSLPGRWASAVVRSVTVTQARAESPSSTMLAEADGVKDRPPPVGPEFSTRVPEAPDAGSH